MSTTWTIVLVAAGVGAGFYLGAKYVQGEVHTGAVGAFDDLLGRVGVNVHDGYGRVAHTLADTIVGEVLGG
jgi:hypothetical protein